jgi:hypothetical protein
MSGVKGFSGKDRKDRKDRKGRKGRKGSKYSNEILKTKPVFDGEFLTDIKKAATRAAS